MINIILKDSVIYGIGTILPRIVTFLTVPIFIKYFTPEEFGTLELLTTSVSLIVIFIGLGLDNSLSYYFFKYKRQRKNLIKTVLIMRLISSFLFFIMAIIIFEVSQIYTNLLLDYKYILLVVLFNSIFYQFTFVLIEIFRLEFKPRHFVIASNIHSISSTALSVYIGVYEGGGVFGYFFGLLIPTVTVFFGLFFIKKVDFWTGRYDHRIMLKTLKFGLPMLPAALSMYIITSLDKWMISFYLGAKELAIYALGVKFALMFKLVIDIFRKAWWPHAVKAMCTPKGESLFYFISLFYAVMVSIGIIIYSILMPYVFELIGTEQYSDSKIISLLLILEASLYGYFMIGGMGMWKKEKTYISTVLMIFSALINIVFNVILIQKYHIFGAAIATVISSLIWMALSLYVSQRLWKVRLNIKVFFLLIILAFLISIEKYLFDFTSSWVFMSIVVLYVAIVFYSIKTMFSISAGYE